VPGPGIQALDDEHFVAVRARDRWASGEGATFAIADRDDRLVGTIELRISPVDPAAGDVGFLMAPHARRRGYASAALRTVAEWGIAALGLARVEWRAEVGNQASRGVARRAGFTEEGVARAAIVQRDGRRDAWIGTLLAGDVRQAQAEAEVAGHGR
jgi:RimJ/RimL family protein N-acetyltransferase